MRTRRNLTLLGIALLLTSLAAPELMAQCILANPSFEVQGSGGYVFGGWEQFGVFGLVGEAYHGNLAARVSGPNAGGWDVSGYWQQMDTHEGEQWEVTGHVRHPASNPLTGQCAAIVNVEWRDSGGELIDYDSFTVADAASPTDEFIDFNLLSSPAPAGAVATRILLGVLQNPTDPSPEVHYDEITFYDTSYPTIDDMQWTDFPGGRTLEFAGRTWHVKGPGYYGPGPSNFCHLPGCVWVDGEGRLHLSIKYLNSSWNSTEVVLEEALGYGDYVFTIRGDLDQFDVHTVLGLFLWQYGPCWDEAYLWWNPYNEIDVEASRWGWPGNDLLQFVAQPYDWPGNIERFDTSFGADELSSHAFNWLKDRVEFRSWRGGPGDESPENMIHEWTYGGPHIPRPEQPRVHMNLWQFDGPPATEQELVVEDFNFIPAGEPVDVADPGESAPGDRIGLLHPVSPNPFNPRTRVRFTLLRDAEIELSVHDITGAKLRSLAGGFREAGDFETSWDGRNDAGRLLSSGVYLCTLRVADQVQSQRMVLIK